MVRRAPFSVDLIITRRLHKTLKMSELFNCNMISSYGLHYHSLKSPFKRNCRNVVRYVNTAKCLHKFPYQVQVEMRENGCGGNFFYPRVLLVCFHRK